MKDEQKLPEQRSLKQKDGNDNEDENLYGVGVEFVVNILKIQSCRFRLGNSSIISENRGQLRLPMAGHAP